MAATRYSIRLDNTRFIHPTHLSGVIDQYHQFPSRDAPIVISNPQAVDWLLNNGFESIIKWTAPKGDQDPNTFVSEPFIYCTLKFKKDGVNVYKDPDVYLVESISTPPVRMTPENIAIIDNPQMSYEKISAMLTATFNHKGNPVVYIDVLYCYQRIRDPWAQQFMQNG